MSSANPKPAIGDSASPAALTGPERDWLSAELADGLHALAQPLTILRSAIGMLALSKEEDASRQRFLDLSVRQIDRTCALFESVQDLVALQLEPASQLPVDLQALFLRIVEEQASAYQAAGVELVANSADFQPRISADPQRTEKAIAASLATALSISARGDRIEMNVTRSGDSIEVVIAGSRGRGRTMNSSERLNLAVAKANILSQQSRYHFAEEPFCVTLALPVCKVDAHTEEKFSAAYASK
jgi:light-regulated signal transduction histidine kinase (bacteriophytochrome)